MSLADRRDRHNGRLIDVIRAEEPSLQAWKRHPFSLKSLDLRKLNVSLLHTLHSPGHPIISLIRICALAHLQKVETFTGPPPYEIPSVPL